jgi:ArsR family transcriptional regulator
MVCMSASLPTPLVRLSEMCHALSDPTRLQVLAMLRYGERCVCDLTDALESGQSRLSFHLKTLKDAGLVQDRREGRWAYYSLTPGALEELQEQLGGSGKRPAVEARRSLLRLDLFFTYSSTFLDAEWRRLCRTCCRWYRRSTARRRVGPRRGPPAAVVAPPCHAERGVIPSPGTSMIRARRRTPRGGVVGVTRDVGTRRRWRSFTRAKQVLDWAPAVGLTSCCPPGE